MSYSPQLVHTFFPTPRILSPEIQVGFFGIAVKADMAIYSIPKVAVFVKFGPVALAVYLRRGNRNLSTQVLFLGEGIPAGTRVRIITNGIILDCIVSPPIDKKIVPGWRAHCFREYSRDSSDKTGQTSYSMG